MTYRIRHLTVTLNRDYRDDDAQPIIDALLLIRGVSKVTTNVVELARAAVESEIRMTLHDAIEAAFKKERP